MYVTKSKEFKPYVGKPDPAQPNKFPPGVYVDEKGYVTEAPAEFIDKYRTLDSFYHYAAKVTPDELKKIINALPADDISKVPGMIWAENDQYKQILESFAVRINIFQSDNVRKILSTDEIDFADFVGKKTVCYIINSDQNPAFKLLIALFTSFAFMELTKYADAAEDECLPVPVYMLFEEIYSAGKIQDFANKLSTVRSRNINVLICTQALGQLQNMYSDEIEGKKAWEIILGCCAVTLCLGVGDETSQRYISNLIGSCTLKLHERKAKTSIFNFLKLHANFDESVKGKKRMLMMPDELYRLKKSEIIICVQGSGNACLKKAYYKDLPEARNVVLQDGKEIKIKAANYYPVWRQKEMIEQYNRENRNRARINENNLIPRLSEVYSLNDLKIKEVYEVKRKHKDTLIKKLYDIFNHARDIDDEVLGDNNIIEVDDFYIKNANLNNSANITEDEFMSLMEGNKRDLNPHKDESETKESALAENVYEEIFPDDYFYM